MDNEQRFKPSDGEDFDRAITDKPTEKIKLLTRSGELVAVVEIPAFVEYPEVVVWGDRVFQLQTVSKTGELVPYNEIFCYVVPPGAVAEGGKYKACEVKVDDKRDPEHPCECFSPGEPGIFGNCYGDGHYLCLECEEYVSCDEEE